MLRSKRYVDCPEHGTQEGYNGRIAPQTAARYGVDDPRAQAAIEAVSEHKGKWAFLAKMPHGTLFCPDCYAILPYREMRMAEGRKTEKCGPLCLNAKRELCNCICLGA